MHRHDGLGGPRDGAPRDVRIEAAERRGELVAPRDRRAATHAQHLGRAKLADRERPTLHDDVAQVPLDGERLHCGAAGSGERNELAGCARDPHVVRRRVPRYAARRGAHGAACEDRPGRLVDRHERPAGAERDVHATCAVFDEPSGLVSRLQGHGVGDRTGRKEHAVDEVAVGVGSNGARAIGRHEQRAAGDWRRRDGGDHGRPEVRADGREADRGVAEPGRRVVPEVAVRAAAGTRPARAWPGVIAGVAGPKRPVVDRTARAHAHGDQQAADERRHPQRPASLTWHRAPPVPATWLRFSVSVTQPMSPG